MKMIVIDADYAYNRNSDAVVRLYGKIVGGVDEGKDIVLHVLGMEPYFYCDNSGLDIFELQKIVEKVLKGYAKRVDVVMRYRPVGYQVEKTPMLKITLFNPKTTPECRDMLKNNINEITSASLYEADIVYVNRFMVDMDMNGMDVIEFNENGKELQNYGLNCDKLYIVDRGEIRVLKDEIVKIEY
ncbi:MAG: 3'-5' exonuclease [Candidatus Dojkabacteria bacterium]|nr:3'-5' exonuclease [Candidatus Dojkabacteria bacterium]